VIDHRTIRSFVRRTGRLTIAQRRELEGFPGQYGLEPGRALLDLPEIFGRSAPLWVEIGFGDGDSLVQLAADNPALNFIGIEVYPPGVGHILQMIREQELSNLRIIREDAADVLQRNFPNHAIDNVMLYFPDPWPKKRHHKRRLVQSPFIELLARKIRPGGLLYMATDWEDYAQHIKRVMTQSPFVELVGIQRLTARSEHRPETKFERRGRALGHSVWDLAYKRGPINVGA
jgi:tRNA (guanine-N7-)-methyltransferase